MSDTQAAMREFRFLDDKRKTNGLTPQEEQRWYELAAQLGVDMSQYGQWGADGQWYPYPAGYDPNQQWAQQQQQPEYYDPNQPQQQQWYGQDQQQPYYDPNQAPYDPNQPAYDPNQAQAPYDPNQPQAPYDPNQPAAYDPNQPYDPNQQQGYGYQQQPQYDPNQYQQQYPQQPGYPPPQQQGWYGQQQQPYYPNQQPGYGYAPSQQPQGYQSVPQPWPGQHAPVPAPPWASQQQPTQAQPWQQPPAPLPPAAAPDDVMEISDDEVSPVPTAPPPQSRPNPLPPLNMSVGNDSVDDLRSALLDEVPVAPAPAAEPPPVKLPAMPLFGGAGFSKAPPPERKVEATAVSSLLPGPADDLPLVDAAGSKGAETQIEAAAANALSDSPAAEEISEASISQVTEISDVEVAMGEVPTVSPSGVTELPSDSVTEMLPDLPMLEAKKPAPMMAELNADVVIDPTPSMVMDAGAVEAVLDPTPSMMLDVPPLEEPAQASSLLDIPALAPEPTPVVEALPEVEVAASEAPVSFTEALPEVEVAASEAPVSFTEALPAVEVAPPLEAPVSFTEAPIEQPEAPPPSVVEPSVIVADVVESPVMMAEPLEATTSAEPAVAFDAPIAEEPAAPFIEDSVPPTEPSLSLAQAVAAQAPTLVEVPAADPFEAPLPVATEAVHVEQSFDVSMSEPAGDSNWDAVVEASRAPEQAPPEPFAPSAEDLPVIDSTPEPVVAGNGFEAALDDLPVVSGEGVVEAAVVPPSSASSAFDALAIPPPLPSTPSSARAPSLSAPHPTSDVSIDSWDETPVTQSDLPTVTQPEILASNWDAPAPAAPAPQAEVFASSWEEPAAPAAPVPQAEVVASSWEEPAAPAPQAEVFASSWEEAPAPVESAPQTEVFAASWEEAPPAAEPAPQTEVFAQSWEAPAPATEPEVFASNWDNAVPGAELSGNADDKVELASNAEFIQGSLQSELPTMDVGDVAIDNEPFEVESGPAASLATGVIDSSASSVDDAPIELASNADFLGAQALTSTGESWQRSDASIEVAEEPEGEIIQGIVVEEEPAAESGWDAAIPAPAPVRAIDTRVAVPVAPAPMPPPVAPPPVQQRAPAIQAAAPVVQPVVQPPPRAMADQLFDRSGTVRGGGSPVVIRGDHRVILHTMEGQVKRGALKDPDLGAENLSLEGTAGGVESIALGRVKAIFFMLAPGARSPAGDGQKVRVTFKDGRQVAGFSRDHQQGGPGFFVVPADNRTNTERIYIYRHGVQTVGIEG